MLRIRSSLFQRHTFQVPSYIQKLTMSTAQCSSSNEIAETRQNALAILTLNRPKALNALNTGMVEDLYTALNRYESDPNVSAILIKGAGEKAFCAGGDVKAVVQMSQNGQVEEAMHFFRSEYKLNYKVANLQKPYIAFMDGITMGGGAGVSVHGDFRVATERTLFAMPECGIGLITDIGASYFLPRLSNSLGLYISLTGCRLSGIDTVTAGLATHYIHSSRLDQVEQALVALGHDAKDKTKINHVLNQFSSSSSSMDQQAATTTLTPENLITIRSHFALMDGTTDTNATAVEGIYQSLRTSGTEFANKTLELMARGSPTSQKLVIHALTLGQAMPLDECLKMEYRIVHHLVARQNSDFHSGVEATLITRTGKPVWNPSSLSDVDKSTVEAMFEKLPPAQELQLPAPESDPNQQQQQHQPRL